MYNMMKMSAAAVMLAVALITLNGCGDDEEGTPSKPQVTSDVSLLPVEFGETKSFTVNISTAGKLKSVTAATTVGSVTVSDVTGMDGVTGSAKINYEAPFEEGTAKITVTVTDKIDQVKTYEVDVNITALPPVELAGGNVEGTWGPNMTYIVRGNLTVPDGKSLTIKEGVTVIMEGDGSQGNSPELVAVGNLYVIGTEEKPVLFSVPENKRTKENIFAGLWGGILGTADTDEMVILYTRIEYFGGPAAAGTTIVTSGELDEGDPRMGLYFNNPEGKFIMMHSTLAFSTDDGMRINQGEFLIAYNTYIHNGETGGDALNIKSGSKGDAAFNVFFQAATNGIKCSNSDNRSPQTTATLYNNTAINCGWRQAKSGRGGSFNLEKGARGNIYNNIIANCRYGVRLPKSPDQPDLTNVSVGYNLYFGNDDVIVDGFYPTTGSLVHGDMDTNQDVIGAADANDPKFVSFDVTNFDFEAAANPANLNLPAAMNLKLAAGSPALNKGKTGLATTFNAHTVNGATYNVPAPAAYIGAYGN